MVTLSGEIWKGIQTHVVKHKIKDCQDWNQKILSSRNFSTKRGFCLSKCCSKKFLGLTNSNFHKIGKSKSIEFVFTVSRSNFQRRRINCAFQRTFCQFDLRRDYILFLEENQTLWINGLFWTFCAPSTRATFLIIFEDVLYKMDEETFWKF